MHFNSLHYLVFFPLITVQDHRAWRDSSYLMGDLHVNKRGAELFTARVADVLRRNAPSFVVAAAK